jgi:hypothetical protein
MTLTPKAKSPRIPNDDLLTAGLDLMRQNGKPLTKDEESFGRSMRYKMADGKTVRVRTCNDHILIVLADKASKNAKLNIEGTDYLLVVMPEIERTPGKVKAYLVPTKVAAEASRSSHQTWLDKGPNTKGDNRTWNLWFREDGPKDRNYSMKWAEYQLKGEAVTTHALTGGNAVDAVSVNVSDGSVKSEVEMARLRISKVAGVAPDAVKITIAFG